MTVADLPIEIRQRLERTRIQCGAEAFRMQRDQALADMAKQQRAADVADERKRVIHAWTPEQILRNGR